MYQGRAAGRRVSRAAEGALRQEIHSQGKVVVCFCSLQRLPPIPARLHDALSWDFLKCRGLSFPSDSDWIALESCSGITFLKTVLS